MASSYFNFQRIPSALAAVAFAAASSDFSTERFTGRKYFDAVLPSVPSLLRWPDSSVSMISLPNNSDISFIAKAWPWFNSGVFYSSDSLLSSTSVTFPRALLDIYHYAKLAKPSQNHEFYFQRTCSSSDVLYLWHLPYPNVDGILGMSKSLSAKSQTVVILLGWLGAKQNHLKKYAKWYTSRGFHAVTFTFPMSEVVSYKAGGKVEFDVELLADHLADWVAEESGKNLVFHTFSNTGWLTYGVILEKFQQKDPSVMGRIKGCIVDSAPVANPDSQVWAFGFSAAFLKKQSVATKGTLYSNVSEKGVEATFHSLEKPKPAVFESVILTILEKFFDVVLNLPAINRRLSDVLYVLSTQQPKCPQLYIYSSADRVIPAKSVESFVEKQRIAGHVIRACNFGNSPHVDHFRSHPNLYSSQLTSFFEDCVLIESK